MACTINAIAENDLTVRELDQALHACTIDENIEVIELLLSHTRSDNKADRKSSALPLAASLADGGSSAQLEIMKMLLNVVLMPTLVIPKAQHRCTTVSIVRI